MLKALELIGFKSFAERTRFEFPEGITVVVGPNGSGKSNIVDGIKWVLGEQSAKSLRGKDMADVIFKGTGANGRKPLNTAEATLIFDNTQAVLPIDAPEVHITRRVYRSGEGEYLINGKPCRLKDIRDMCRGTGVGVDAYSLIEQGKVDRLLQASPKDRRAIFEEAAGISRFKAKKLEAQRRLERVEQNLLRLSDIVEEVESRLRSVRAQASKAERYREYSQRLQDLRTQVGYSDWRRLSDKLEGIQEQRQALAEQIEREGGELDELDTRGRQAEQAADEVAEALRRHEAALAENRAQIASRQSNLVNLRRRHQEFVEQAQRHRQQLWAMSGRADNLAQRLKELVVELQRAEAEYGSVRGRLETREREIADLSERSEAMRQASQQRRADYFEQMRVAAALGNQISRLESQVSGARSAVERIGDKLEEWDQQTREDARELEQSRVEEARLDKQATEQAGVLEAADLEMAETRRILARRQQETAILQGQHTAARQRAQMLEDLHRQQAGLSCGVQQLLAEAEPLAGEGEDWVHGVVADLVEAGVEIAPLIDIALGETAQHVVLSGDSLLRYVESERFEPRGRVGIIRLESFSHTPGAGSVSGWVPRGDLKGRPGVIGRADRLVRHATAYRGLIHHLLGDTWLVDQLADARALSRTAGRGMRFVTTRRQLIERDGTLIIGPPQSDSGLVSRRSELRALQQEIVDKHQRIRQFLAETTRLQENLDRQDRQRQLASATHKQVTAALADQRVRTRTLQDRHDRDQRQRDSLAAEWQAARDKSESAAAQLEPTKQKLTAVEEGIRELDRRILEDDRQIQDLEQQLREASSQATLAKVELARSEQRLESLQAQQAQSQTDHQERSRTIAETRAHRDQAWRQGEQAELDSLHVTSELALLYLSKESLARRAQESHSRRLTLNAQRSELVAARDRVRSGLRGLEAEQHRLDLAAGELQHERQTLAERLREDYGIEIAEISRLETAEQQQQRDEVEGEIADLRRRIHRIGAVNLEALDEIDDLQARYDSLSGQYGDLTQAKESLERIIHKINADSRRLFVETLEAIRNNFQQLYRRAFGGGRADLVMEENADVLECGIDILATPPGKPSFNNSLLSGGEKALTAVALLLAIFQFRPSPFCILDEVDAPFDEANIGRFLQVLYDFLDWTKFVIVTHSKKTMTAATTIYGVTMQESGVSKRVSVRFEDVSEDGHISDDAVRRAERDEEQAA